MRDVPAQQVPVTDAFISQFDATLVADFLAQQGGIGLRDRRHVDIGASAYQVDGSVQRALVDGLSALDEAFQVAEQHLGVADDGRHCAVAGEVVDGVLIVILAPHKARLGGFGRVIEALLQGGVVIGAHAILRAHEGCFVVEDGVVQTRVAVLAQVVGIVARVVVAERRTIRELVCLEQSCRRIGEAPAAVLGGQALLGQAAAEVVLQVGDVEDILRVAHASSGPEQFGIAAVDGVVTVVDDFLPRGCGIGPILL